jgi:uroporphyrinogen decarboxylase
MMTARERVLAVLAGATPDRVPWVENHISNEIAEGLLGTPDFCHATYSSKIEKPGTIRIPPDVRRVIPLDSISYDLAPPRYAKTEKIDGHDHLTEGLIKTTDDLKLLDNLPDPDDESMYRSAEEFLRHYKADSAAIATVRTGLSNTYLSMGIEHFCISLILEPGLVREVMDRFSDWSAKVARNVQELPFDFFFIPDDIGFGNAPMISPEHFREFCIPIMKKVINVMKIPAVYHSDGRHCELRARTHGHRRGETAVRRESDPHW